MCGSNERPLVGPTVGVDLGCASSGGSSSSRGLIGGDSAPVRAEHPLPQTREHSRGSRRGAQGMSETGRGVRDGGADNS